MKIIENHSAWVHYRNLNLTYHYNTYLGVKLKKSVKISISGDLLSELEDADIGKLLQKLSLVVRGKDQEKKEISEK